MIVRAHVILRKCTYLSYRYVYVAGTGGDKHMAIITLFATVALLQNDTV